MVLSSGGAHGCPKCVTGFIALEEDWYGKHYNCLNCGHLIDLGVSVTIAQIAGSDAPEQPDEAQKPGRPRRSMDLQRYYDLLSSMDMLSRMGAKETALYTGSGLSRRRAERYLLSLVNAGYLAKGREGNWYNVTGEGLVAMSALSKIIEGYDGLKLDELTILRSCDDHEYQVPVGVKTQNNMRLSLAERGYMQQDGDEYRLTERGRGIVTTASPLFPLMDVEISNLRNRQGYK